MPHPELRLGTRGSPLALWQAREVARRIADAGGPPCRIVAIRTAGDRLQDAPLSTVGGKRLFVKEIEDALLREEIDLAVHSSKDLPAQLPPGLLIASVLPREDPRDAVVLPPGAHLEEATLRGVTADRDAEAVVAGQGIEALLTRLGPSPSIGTGSVRRVAQLARMFPRARFTPIRGNLDTRLRKLDAGEHDALVLAAAGLHRLGFQSRISLALPPDVCVPAPGQGIVAVETRENDRETRNIVAQIDDRAAAAALLAERAVVEAVGGGCQTPLGALASIVGGTIDVMAIIVAIDGSRAVRSTDRGPLTDAAAVGARVGAHLIAQGGDEILADAQRGG